MQKNLSEEGTVQKILYCQNGTPGQIIVEAHDFVVITLGSMIEDISLGDQSLANQVCLLIIVKSLPDIFHNHSAWSGVLRVHAQPHR